MENEHKFEFTVDDARYSISDLPTGINLTNDDEVVVFTKNLIAQDTDSFTDGFNFYYDNLLEFFEL